MHLRAIAVVYNKLNLHLKFRPLEIKTHTFSSRMNVRKCEHCFLFNVTCRNQAISKSQLLLESISKCKVQNVKLDISSFFFSFVFRLTRMNFLWFELIRNWNIRIPERKGVLFFVPRASILFYPISNVIRTENSLWSNFNYKLFNR